MKRYRIDHHTTYRYLEPVELKPHILRLRPREGHELRIESSSLDIFPAPKLRWHRDVENNSVCTASFVNRTNLLTIKSQVFIQQFDITPFDFLVSDYAVDYPFDYSNEDLPLLSPYLGSKLELNSYLQSWISELSAPGESLQSIVLLQRLNQRIYRSFTYMKREEEGVQSANKTLSLCSGSCRDFANLFMVIAQQLGFAARFVSGYVYSNGAVNQPGSSHAWAEVFIPGAGWKGFDPTIGELVGSQHITLAVARLPESVSPVSGAYFGIPGAAMEVSVWVNEVALQSQQNQLGL